MFSNIFSWIDSNASMEIITFFWNIVSIMLYLFTILNIKIIFLDHIKSSEKSFFFDGSYTIT